MRNYEGELVIEGADLWAFVGRYNSQLPDDMRIDGSNGGFGDPKWITKSQELEIPHIEGVTLYIPGEAFWLWIIQDFCPSNTDEFAFNEPHWDADMQTMFLKFAGSNECHPSVWFTKPEWMV